MRLLFITSTRLGDAVLSTGLLDHLLSRHPGARVTVAAGPVPAPLFAAVPGLERLLPMPKQRHSGHWWRLWRQTVTRPWSLVVDLRGSALGWGLPAWRRRRQGKADPTCHRVESLARFLGVSPPPAPRVWTTPADEAAAAALIPADRPVLALGPTANWRAKVWPAERFVATAQALTAPNGPRPGAAVAVLAGPGAEERAAADAVLQPLARSGPVIDLVGQAPLPVLAAALRRVALYVGNDSGLMHLAAAAGAPTLGLFGPSREEHYAPWGPRARAVRTDLSYDALCPPGSFHYATVGCMMEGLPVTRVTAAAEALLAEGS